jgi:hypothetical protein
MKRTGMVKRFVKPIALWLIIVQMAIFLLSPTIATGGTTDLRSSDQNLLHRRADVIKILSVLENRTEDQKILEKARDKLFNLSDRQFSLVASLSKRIAKEGNKAGTEMAFLLITVLITLDPRSLRVIVPIEGNETKEGTVTG